MPLLHIDDAIERLVSYLHEEITTPPSRWLKRRYGEQFRVALMRVQNALMAIGRGTRKLTRAVLPQANAHAIIGRRAASAGIAIKLGNHSFRATGITAYLRHSSMIAGATRSASMRSNRS